jgi:hypothetical protein
MSQDLHYNPDFDNPKGITFLEGLAPLLSPDTESTTVIEVEGEATEETIIEID